MKQEVEEISKAVAAKVIEENRRGFRRIRAILDKFLRGLAATGEESPVKIGGGFPFIDYCDPGRGILRMKVRRNSGIVESQTFVILGKERGHYVLQFVRARKSRVRLRPFRAGKPVDLSHVFRENRGCNHVAFYRFVRTTGGSKATYWLEQTLLRRKPKHRDSVMTRQGAKIM